MKNLALMACFIYDLMMIRDSSLLFWATLYNMSKRLIHLTSAHMSNELHKRGLYCTVVYHVVLTPVGTWIRGDVRRTGTGGGIIIQAGVEGGTSRCGGRRGRIGGAAGACQVSSRSSTDLA